MRIGELKRPALPAGALCCAAAFFFAPFGLLTAGEPQTTRLIDGRPFDEIVVRDAEGTRVLRVSPIDLPERRIPENPKPRDTIQVRLLDEPGKVYEVAWRDIQELRLFEQMVLEEAERLTEREEFEAAYDDYEFLLRRYPKTPGLEESLENYLYRNAGDLFSKGNYARALAVLRELRRRNPEYEGGAQTLPNALAAVYDKVIGAYVEGKTKDYGAARELLREAEAELGTPCPPAVSQWRDRLVKLAEARRDMASERLRQNRLREAYEASRRMLAIWPDVEGGRELAARIAARYPLVDVAVDELSPGGGAAPWGRWSTRRDARLADRLLVEFLGPGPEGGQYVSPLGSLARSEDRRRLTIQLSHGAAVSGPAETGYDVARRILSAADPSSPYYSTLLEQLLKEVRVEEVFRVVLELRRPHVLPEGLLQIPLSEGDRDSSGESFTYASYALASRSETRARYVAEKNYRFATPHRPAEVIERVFESRGQAIAALRRGEIDVIDRLFPADAAQLLNDPDLRVAPYRIPTLHLLAPNPKNPYLANRTFRRALVYAIDRAGILKRTLLGGSELPGCRVISGPFPAGRREFDPLAYAYDERIEPRPYEPQLAFLLARMGREEAAAAAEKRGEPAPEAKPLVLGYPGGDSARLAARAIAGALSAVKIPCKLQPLPPGWTEGSDPPCDLVYLEAAVWDPIVDARRLLDPVDAPRPGASYVEFGLRRLEAASSWKEGRQCLYDLHRIAHDELPVIPLWQTVDYFAHRPELQGLGDRPVTLYQHIEQWRLAPEPEKKK